MPGPFGRRTVPRLACDRAGGHPERHRIACFRGERQTPLRMSSFFCYGLALAVATAQEDPGCKSLPHSPDPGLCVVATNQRPSDAAGVAWNATSSHLFPCLAYTNVARKSPLTGLPLMVSLTEAIEFRIAVFP